MPAASAGADPGYDAGHVYLIRPDAYVVLSTDGGGAATIIAALERITGGAQNNPPLGNARTSSD